MEKKGSATQDKVIGCKNPFNNGDFECAVIFEGDHPGTGIFSYYYEERPAQYACISRHRHNSCGSSWYCDETNHSVDFNEETPLYFMFCRECAEKIKKGWKHSGEGEMVTTDMTDEVRLRLEGEARMRRMEAEVKKKVKLERRASKLKESKAKAVAGKK